MNTSHYLCIRSQYISYPRGEAAVSNSIEERHQNPVADPVLARRLKPRPKSSQIVAATTVGVVIIAIRGGGCR